MSGPLRREGPLPAGASRAELVAECRRVLDAALRPGAGAVLAVSGGADSVALACLVAEARPDLTLQVGHVRHGLRDDAVDAACATACAAYLGLELHEMAVRVERSGQGLEAAARTARYDALHALGRALGAEAVLVGHTADDQAETVLLNLARGSGLAGAAAMDADRADERGLRVVRPLLRLRRADVRAVPSAAGLRWAEDPTNTDLAQRRARARHEALPALQRLSGGPGDAVGALVRFADQARRDHHALEVLAEREYRRLGRRWGPVVALPSAHLAAMPEGLALRVVRRTAGDLVHVPPPPRHLRAALSLSPGQQLCLPTLRVTAGGGWLALAPDGLGPLAARPVVLPGVTPLPELDLTLCTDLAREPVPARLLAPAPPGGRQPSQARLPVAPDAALALRAREPGDRIRLRHGSRSLQDLLVDAGVPRLLRDLLPVLVDGRDQPVWIPGVAVARAPESLSHVRAWIVAAAGAQTPGGGAR